MMRALITVLLLLAASASAQPSRFGANEGQVMEIDKDAGEITIHHGPLPELGMDPMAMIFKVADRTLLDRVRKGDRISFKAGLVDGRFAVVEITAVKPRRKEPR